MDSRQREALGALERFGFRIRWSDQHDVVVEHQHHPFARRMAWAELTPRSARELRTEMLKAVSAKKGTPTKRHTERPPAVVVRRPEPVVSLAERRRQKLIAEERNFHFYRQLMKPGLGR